MFSSPLTKNGKSWLIKHSTFKDKRTSSLGEQHWPQMTRFCFFQSYESHTF